MWDFTDLIPRYEPTSGGPLLTRDCRFLPPPQVKTVELSPMSANVSRDAIRDLTQSEVGPVRSVRIWGPGRSCPILADGCA